MSEPTIYRVKAATVDKRVVTLYTEDGEIVNIQQGDPRLSKLMDEITPILARNEIAVVELENFCAYADFEKKSKGVVRFFKAARNKLASLIGIDVTKQVTIVSTTVAAPTPVAPVAAPTEATPQPAAAPASSGLELTVEASVREGVENTAPVIQEKVTARLKPAANTVVEANETVVAVIGDLVIPDVDKLQPYIAHAVRHNSVQAVENFLRRAAAIAKDRLHSVVDLMRFLEHADLPLADDGSIIAYKVLRKKGTEKGIYVDCHSGRVTQRVGSYVCVDEKLVDPNRRNECSNGLHIARRGYLGSFSGDVLVLCKIEPEDVMVVPHGDPNKVRVKGYHILAELSNSAWQKLRDDRPMTDEDDAKTLVAKAIKGDHVARLEEVRVHGQNGRDVVITPLVQQAVEVPVEPLQISDEEKKRATALDEVTAKNNAPPVDPKAVNQRVAKEIKEVEKAKAKMPKPTSKTASKPASKPKTKTPPKKETKIAPKTPAKADLKPKGANSSLTAEQNTVLKLISEGVSQSEVARQTGVSRRTVGRWVEQYGTKTSK